MQILHEFLRLGVDYSTTSLLHRRSSSPPPHPPRLVSGESTGLLRGKLWRAVFRNVGQTPGLWHCCQGPLFCHVSRVLFLCIVPMATMVLAPVQRQPLFAKEGKKRPPLLGSVLTWDTALIHGTKGVWLAAIPAFQWSWESASLPQQTYHRCLGASTIRIKHTNQEEIIDTINSCSLLRLRETDASEHYAPWCHSFSFQNHCLFISPMDM